MATRVLPAISGTFLVICGLVTGVIIVVALFTGPARWEAGERMRAAQIADENGIYCQKLRMPQGTADFALCVENLSDIRKHQAERSARDAAGII